MHKQQLGRTIFLIVGRLLQANLGEIPQDDASISRGRRKDGRAVRGPGELQNFFRVRAKRVQLDLEVAQIPQRNRLSWRAALVSRRINLHFRAFPHLVGRARDENVFVVWGKGHRVDLGRVRFDAGRGLDSPGSISPSVPPRCRGPRGQ